VILTDQRAAEYCQWLGKRSRLPIRLPIEDEWEAACRAGTLTEWCSGDSPGELAQFAVFTSDPWGNPTPPPDYAVGQRRPNGWGLFDMHGGVWEWCARRPTDPSHPPARGGCLELDADNCRSASRFAFVGLWPVGVRPAFVLPNNN
jgi:formylglycine-generating enzyme required for sulfatase activity